MITWELLLDGEEITFDIERLKSIKVDFSDGGNE